MESVAIEINLILNGDDIFFCLGFYFSSNLVLRMSSYYHMGVIKRDKTIFHPGNLMFFNPSTHELMLKCCMLFSKSRQM